MSRRDPEYGVWAQMIQRCHNPKDRGFGNWGGRGIVVCGRWRRSYRAFIADMGRRPQGVTPAGRAVYSIDRINNDGDYEPGNCRWATQSAQAKNRRPVRPAVRKAAEAAGVTCQAIRYRLSKGLSLEEAATKPIDPRGRPRKSA